MQRRVRVDTPVLFLVDAEGSVTAMDLGLTGRVANVTGRQRRNRQGDGGSVARRGGESVAICGRDEQRLGRRCCRAGPSRDGCSASSQMDSVAEDCQWLVNETADTYGHHRHPVNNAGTSRRQTVRQGRRRHLYHTTWTRKVMAATRRAWPRCPTHARAAHGRIVNVTGDRAASTPAPAACPPR